MSSSPRPVPGISVAVLRGARRKSGPVAPLPSLPVLPAGCDWHAAALGQRRMTTGAGRLIRTLSSARSLTAAVAGAVSVLVLLPDRLRLDKWTPFAQVVAFRPVFVAATGAWRPSMTLP